MPGFERRSHTWFSTRAFSRSWPREIGSSDRVDEIFRLGQAGLKFAHHLRPPRALPARPGLLYFQVNRAAQAEEWVNVQRSQTLAIRLNENRIVGNIGGQKRLTVQVGGQTTTLGVVRQFVHSLSVVTDQAMR